MVEQSSIAQMARLIAIINDQPDGRAGQDDTRIASLNHAAAPSARQGASPQASSVQAAADGNIAAMKTILERFKQGSETAAGSLVTATRDDRALREAMITEATDTGLSIGDWQITAKADSGRRLYDVAHRDQAHPIACDLTLFEAARGLANALNDGLPVTSPRIRDLLRLENDYASAAHNAIHAKHALRKQPLGSGRRAILEDKYGAAVRRGHAARDQLLALEGPL